MSTYSYGHRKPTSVSATSPGSAATSRSVLARVVDIVLNSSHKDYQTFGKDKSINGIRYRLLTSTVIQGDEQFVRDQLPFAYQEDTNIKRIPLIGEIVEIRPQTFSDKPFYSFPKNANNSTLANINPDLSNEEYIEIAENEIEGVRKANQLESIKGDVILEGRSGQSLRFSSFKTPRWDYIDPTASGSPITVLRNGQGAEPVGSTVFEDINKDDSSVYLTSNHVLPITPGSRKRKSYLEKPTEVDTFRGKQAVVNADRVVINSREDSTLLSGKKSVGLSAESVNLDGSVYVGIDAPKVYLGEEASREDQPAVRGEALTAVLNDLVSTLTQASALLKTAAPNPVAITLALQNVAGVFDSHANTLKALIPDTKSKKVFVE